MEWRRRGRVHSPGRLLGIDYVHDEGVYKGFRAGSERSLEIHKKKWLPQLEVFAMKDGVDARVR